MTGGVRLSDLGIGVTDVMTTITDQRVINNIVNFDKQSAIEIMKAVTELDREARAAANPDATQDNTEADSTPQNQEKKAEEEKPAEPTSSSPDLSQPIDPQGAYQRIVNEASKEEVSTGMAIIAKVDIAKVTELRKSGDMSAVKEYVKSVLTADEISTSVMLYNKYKHLL